MVQFNKGRGRKLRPQVRDAVIKFVEDKWRPSTDELREFLGYDCKTAKSLTSFGNTVHTIRKVLARNKLSLVHSGGEYFIPDESNYLTAIRSDMKRAIPKYTSAQGRSFEIVEVLNLSFEELGTIELFLYDCLDVIQKQRRDYLRKNPSDRALQ